MNIKFRRWSLRINLKEVAALIKAILSIWKD